MRAIFTSQRVGGEGCSEPALAAWRKWQALSRALLLGAGFWSRLWQVTELEPCQELSLLRRNDELGSQKSHQVASLQRHFYITELFVFQQWGWNPGPHMLPKHSTTELRGPGPVFLRQWLPKLPRLVLNSLCSPDGSQTFDSPFPVSWAAGIEDLLCQA